MKRVHFLADREPIVSYTLAPVRHNRRALRERGYDVRIFYKLNNACLDCDILCLLSKPAYKHTGETSAIFQDGGPIVELLKKARRWAGTIIWMDDSDSSSVTHFELLPYIDLYLKKQVLKDYNLYRRPFYGGRIFTEFYHREFGIEDERSFVQFHPLPEGGEKKLRVSWNIGLGDMFSAFSFKNVVQRLAPDLVPVNYDVRLIDPKSERPVDVFIRTSANLSRRTVAFHRQEMLRRLDRYFTAHSSRSGMIGNNVYRAEGGCVTCLPDVGGRLPVSIYREIMSKTKVVPSPFGWGELGVRDYEAFIFGGILLKPNMAHMTTWPDIFVPGETYQPLQWDFQDIDDVIENLIENSRERLRIAENGQDAYACSISRVGMERFCAWFIQQIEVHPA